VSWIFDLLLRPLYGADIAITMVFYCSGGAMAMSEIRMMKITVDLITDNCFAKYHNAVINLFCLLLASSSHYALLLLLSPPHSSHHYITALNSLKC